MPHTYDYPRPALTVDCVIIGESPEVKPKVLLIKRARDPFQGQWAFPGGFVDSGERVELAALRELEEETSLKLTLDKIKLLGVFSKPGRDPRGWTISVAYEARVNIADCRIAAADDALQAEWVSPEEIQEMAFDHLDILAKARL